MRRWVILGVVVVLVLATLGRLAVKSVRGIDVSVARIREGRVVAAVYATGRVDTDRRATVRARVAAPLEEVLVGPGEVVAAGQVVARQNGAALGLASEGAAREVDAAAAALAEAEDAAARAETLVRDKLLAEDAWVRARERARELRAQVEVRRAALALGREQERWVVLRAPLAGTVSTLAHRTGDILREGDDVLTVVDLAPAYVRVAVDERDVGRIAVGQSVRLVFDAFAGKVFDGAVWRLVPAVDRLTKSADVLVNLPQSRPPLQLDMTVTVNIVTGTVERALVVPRDALEGSGEVRHAVVVSGSRTTRREVRVGVCDESQCQVLGGLEIDDPVVSPLPGGLADGQKVRVR